MPDHDFYMTKCIELAQIAKQRGDSPVGAILVQGDKIIAEGIEGGKTYNDITFHAEIDVIRYATELLQTQNLSDCIMYTTHEPCIMCSYVIRHTKINTIICSITTGEIGGFSSKFPLLLDTTISTWSAPPNVVFGIMEKECRELHEQ